MLPANALILGLCLPFSDLSLIYQNYEFFCGVKVFSAFLVQLQEFLWVELDVVVLAEDGREISTGGNLPQECTIIHM